MIDKVNMNKIISLPVDTFNGYKVWRHIKINNRHIDIYSCNLRGLKLFYAVATKRLTIKGRLMLLSELRNRVDNLDAPWRGIADVKLVQHHFDVNGERQIRYELVPVIQDLESLILEINAELASLLQVAIDIREFTVTYCEFCF